MACKLLDRGKVTIALAIRQQHGVVLDWKIATCSLCKAAVSRGGINGTKWNRSNLMKHLKSHHMKKDKFIKSNERENQPEQKTLELEESQKPEERWT